MNIQNDYHQHKQTVIKGLSIQQGLDICKELEDYVDKEYSFVLEVWTDGALTLYQKDFFKEERVGGRDRIILSSEE
jgi:hypothetical protein